MHQLFWTLFVFLAFTNLQTRKVLMNAAPASGGAFIPVLHVLIPA
jgi:hypothetical protein